MSEKIEPVMTAEEWAHHGADVFDGSVVVESGGYIDIHLGGPAGARDSKREMRALMALLNQECGPLFTWEDVDALRNAANGADGIFTSAGALRSVAARIAALLPPRKETQ